MIAINLTGVTIVAFQAGWYGDLHPVPRPQWMMVMTGAVEVEVSDGQKRTFTAGTADSLAYLDYISSKGHITRAVGDELSIVMVAEVD
ncbi:MAG: hypothetical protein V2I25_13540 [Woeseiaceae bacterium]|nr:hypothetical protein [Woeseiaceae bacterium]